MMIKVKRIGAYLIDCLMVMLVTGFISLAANIGSNENIYPSIQRNYQDFQFGDITFMNAFNKIANIIQLNDKNNILSLLITLTSIILLWIIIPYLFNEQTLGLKLFKIKLEMTKKYDLKAITIRTLLLSGLGVLIPSLLLLYITNGIIYCILVLILLIIQILFIIWDGFMILYSSNGHNMVDNVSHTEIVEVKK